MPVRIDAARFFPRLYSTPSVHSPAHRHGRCFAIINKAAVTLFVRGSWRACLSFSRLRRNGILSYDIISILLNSFLLFSPHNSLCASSHFPPSHLHLHFNVCQPDRFIVLICSCLIIGDVEYLFNSSVWLLQSLSTLYVPARL